MSLQLSAIAAFGASAVAAAARPRSRQHADAAADIDDCAVAEGEARAAASAGTMRRAPALTPTAPLAPALLSAVLDLQAAADPPSGAVQTRRLRSYRAAARLRRSQAILAA